MQFKIGTTVYTANGEKVGDIERFVIDPPENKIVGLVVRKGFFFPEDKVIPIKNVLNADEEQVTLKQIDESEKFPPFKETHYVAAHEIDTSEADPSDMITNPTSVYYYPPLQESAWYGGGYFAPRIEVEERNIPEYAIPLEEGANVISRDGKHVGEVKRVYTDPDTEKITHLSIREGILFKKEKLIPATWVDKVMESRVHLSVNSSILEDLPPLE